MSGMPPLALLAGGLATRMRPITETVPKAMIKVADEPFIFHQLRLLRREGIEQVVVCVGYLGEQISEAVGDGSAFGLHVDYAFDGPSLLGTGGALRNALPLLGDPFWVMYGDSYLDIKFEPIHRRFVDGRKRALMTVLHNENQWDTSNVVCAEGMVTLYDKAVKIPTMTHVDYGLSLYRTDVFAALPANHVLDLSDILHNLSCEGQLMAYEVDVRFYEIGSMTGLRDADEYLRRHGNTKIRGTL